jgi:hypothetical protein
MAAPSVMPSVIRSIVLLILLGLLLYGTGKAVLWLFGGNGNGQTPAQLTVEQGGTVNVSVDDGLLQRVEDTMKIYEGDRIVTSASAFAQIRFFDGSAARIDAQSDLRLTASDNDEEEPVWTLTTEKGAVWVRTPALSNYSGAIVRTVEMPRYSVTLVSDTEAVLEESRLMVFSADGQGVPVMLEGVENPVYIGEGQQYELPEGDVSGDPYAYRSAIEPLAVQRDFITKSRTMFTEEPADDTGTGSSIGDVVEPLTITAPVDGTTVTTATVKVEGSVGPTVERVRINGFDTTIGTDRTFSQELTLQQSNSTVLVVEAFDGRGLSLAQRSLTVFKGSKAVGVPVITSPAGAGQIYRTQKTEIAISGTVPAGTAGVMVNDYRLQLFRSGDTTWSYLASKALGNLQDGPNLFTVVALDAAGNRSAAVQITINVEAGTEGVIGGTAGSSASSVLQETDLPNNDPLMPGTLTVTGPQPGSTFTATGSEFLLEGTTPRETASVWVNGYKLQLYKPGATFWNYIAKTEYNTLKPGTNVYRIVARDSKNQILDTFEYTVTYNP